MLALKEMAVSVVSPEKGHCASHGCAAGVLIDLKAGRLTGGTIDMSTRRRLGVLTERLERLRELGGDYARVCFSPEIDNCLDGLDHSDHTAV